MLRTNQRRFYPPVRRPEGSSVPYVEIPFWRCGEAYSRRHWAGKPSPSYVPTWLMGRAGKERKATTDERDSEERTVSSS